MRKAFKLLATALCVVAAASIVSCKKEETPTLIVTSDVLADGVVAVATEGVTSTFNIASNSDWTITCNADWITITPMSGTGNGTVKVSVAEFTDICDERTATINFAVKTMSVSVTVNQAGIPLDVTCDAIVDGALAAATEGLETTFSIVSNTDWTITCNADWITITPMSGTGSQTVKVSVAECTERGDGRTASIDVAAKSTTVSVAVNQAGVPLPQPLSGKFTVGADGHQVQFSRGMVYYDGNDVDLEESQIDYFIKGPSMTAMDPTHVNHFFWNTTVEKAASQRAVSETFSADSKLFIEDTWLCKEAGYRLLTADEMKYLLTDVKDDSDKGFITCIIEDGTTQGICCLILAPDGYNGTLPKRYLDESGLSRSPRITMDDWKSYEAQGVIVLPCASYRYDDTYGVRSFTSGGYYTYYWTSTYSTGSKFMSLRLYSRTKSTNSTATVGAYDYKYGSCIRLVKDVK